jgi:hypothetical protein
MCYSWFRCRVSHPEQKPKASIAEMSWTGLVSKLKMVIEKKRSDRNFIILSLVLLLVPYILYIFFVVFNDQGPVDYETFMRIGMAFRQGGDIYVENSYYPLPYVLIFSLFSSLPRAISMALWLSLPVIVALFVADFTPCVLIFAPVFSHFIGGQSSVFGLLGFWGYRKNLDLQVGRGGFYLALTLLKPQLGIVPLVFAAFQWIKYILEKRKLPRQFIFFSFTIALIYLPSLVIQPGWLGEWLQVPRPIFNRALSGAVPRILMQFYDTNTSRYWIIWLLLSLITFAFTMYFRNPRHHTLDMVLLWGFMVIPLFHDYDLIQVIPTIEGPLMWLMSILLSLPGWWTIVTSYANDAAWITFSIIAPGLLLFMLLHRRGRGAEDS